MDPQRDLTTWPHHECSSLIRVRPHQWHVQQMGQGDTLLLLHGTGGSTHSWRDLMPLLARTHHVVAVDLPGHGFTKLGSRHRSTLDSMAQDLAALCADQGWHPTCIIGHSAGAAVALRLAGLVDPAPSVIGLNPALHPFRGLAGLMFPVAARMLAITPFMVDIALRSMATPGRIVTLLNGTGSKIDTINMNLYARLFRDRAHIDGTLMMMAQWKLDGLLADLPGITTRCLFIAGDNDKMVPPITAIEAADQMPAAQAQSLEALGHLMAEEDAPRIARHILGFVT